MVRKGRDEKPWDTLRPTSDYMYDLRNPWSPSKGAYGHRREGPHGGVQPVLFDGMNANLFWRDQMQPESRSVVPSAPKSIGSVGGNWSQMGQPGATGHTDRVQDTEFRAMRGHKMHQTPDTWNAPGADRPGGQRPRSAARKGAHGDDGNLPDGSYRVMRETQSVSGGPVYSWYDWPGASHSSQGGENEGRVRAQMSRYERQRTPSHFEWKPEGYEAAFSPDEFRRFPLQWSRPITHDSKYCRFFLPTTRHRMGMDVAPGEVQGACVVVRTKDENGKVITRPYTPVSQNHQLGFFDLLVKKYPGGKVSNHIHSLETGDYIEVKGPFAKYQSKINYHEQIGMIAGGTGITPIYQVLIKMLKDPRNKTNFSLVYANNRPCDILLIKELQDLQRRHSRLADQNRPSLSTLGEMGSNACNHWHKPEIDYRHHNRFSLYLTVLDCDEYWPTGIGYISKGVLKNYMPAPGTGNKILVCGPDGMYDAICGRTDEKGGQGELKGLLKEMGYTKDEVFKF